MSGEYEYIKEGDIMIGGVVTVNAFIAADKDEKSYRRTIWCANPTPQNYKYLLDFFHLINEFNNNPLKPQNLTLGYHISDSCGDVYKAERSVLQILSGTREPVPNYSCAGKRNIVGFIGDLTSETTIPIAHILSVLGYSQVSYGATDPSLSDRDTFPYFFRTVQRMDGQYFAITQLLKHLGWTWVGIITTNDIKGDSDYGLLTNYLSSEGICIDFTIKIQNQISYDHKMLYRNIILKSSTSVVIFCGTVTWRIAIKLGPVLDIFSKKTFIFTSDWLCYSNIINYARGLFNGSLVFMANIIDYKNDDHFSVESIHPSNYPEDELLGTIWIRYFSCKPENMSMGFSALLKLLPNCTGKERLTDIKDFTKTLHTRNMLLAVEAFSVASCKLHFIHNSCNNQSSEKQRKVMNFKYQLHRLLKEAQFPSQGQLLKYFNENGEFVSAYEISNFYGTSKESIAETRVGQYVPWAPSDQKLNITLDAIKWKTANNMIPRAQCSDNCPPGYRKAPKPGAQSCCYVCVPCSEGEISNITDSENCIRCPDMEWPNDKRTKCIARTEVFLSFTNDVISLFFSSVSLLFFLLTLLILGVFIIYRDSPIVRANNRSLSFLLLVSIKLSFLSVFLFLGRPVDITCMLRIITFGITFSIAVSSLLAKTIMVCVAFKATKPGSSWRKWLGVKLSNSVVLFCSSIQIIICMTWLAISPPFQELDIHTSPGTIIIQCNEGSAIGFYSVIGYMGLLAAVSFVLAFLARSLPDSFNEAKYITFSMLLFCSVWITMIPAYLSTKGKNTVCVEIFAILTSSAGLLACIFLPKCYIILFRSEINTKSHLLGNKY
uniref:G-protein coupled receptors family 3 profile domain-containing protein n=2 Tax=Xenopus tropicalis TaxID=8364 RepID=A0A1B8Y8A2_XENTR